MTSLSKYACALILASGLAVPAYAATTGTPTPGSTGDASTAGQSASSNDRTPMNGGANGQSANDQNAMHVGQKLRADLSKAGYSDISVAPSSFIVHAKDSQGNPVMMVISPNSVTAITEQNAAPGSASNANHAGAANGANPATGMSTPGKSEAPTKP